MRIFHLTLIGSMLLHTLMLFGLSAVPPITMPATDTLTVTLSSSSVGSGSLNNPDTQTDNNKNETKPQSKLTPKTAEKISQTPKILHTEEKRPASINPEKNPAAKTQPQEKQKSTPSDAQATPSDSDKNDKQGESSNGTGAGSGARSGAGSSGNQGSGKGAGDTGKTTAPVRIYDPVPAYPSAAERLQQQGTVQVVLKINTSGSVSDASILRSSQFSLLDNAAKRTLKSWRFKAAEQDGHAISSSVTINVLFTPEGVKVLR